ncbi:splicing regulator RBM11 isoform X3 [Rhinolophus sinicus]|uniref:splicing regulator RBM11 isoform X3 n=1 Tax=Rhinolophus sinicus TaxID=89399 RepID=UPI003D7BF629
MFPAQEEADRTVFVGNLEVRVREEILYELFLQVPSVGKGQWRRRGPSSLKRSRSGGAHPPGPFGARPPSRAFTPSFGFNIVTPWRTCLQAGPLTKVTICKDKDGKPKSFGFVCFKHPESVSYAIALLNGIRLYGRPINVQYRFGSSRSSEPANQSFESCVKINSHSYRNEEVVGRSSFPMQFFPTNNAALPQEYFCFQRMI